MVLQKTMAVNDLHTWDSLYLMHSRAILRGTGLCLGKDGSENLQLLALLGM